MKYVTLNKSQKAKGIGQSNDIGIMGVWGDVFHPFLCTTTATLIVSKCQYFVPIFLIYISILSIR